MRVVEAINIEQNLYILKLVHDIARPVGAVYLSQISDLSQASVGRSLLSLEQQGYLQKTANKGRCITPAGSIYLAQHKRLQQKLDSAKTIIETTESYAIPHWKDVLSVRIVIEALSAELAADNMTPEYSQALDVIILEHRMALLKGECGSEQDLKLHLKIVEIAGNQVLEQILKLLLTQENVYTKFSMVAPTTVISQVQQHNNIVESLKRSDKAAAKQAMIDHLTNVLKDVREYASQSAAQAPITHTPEQSS